MSSQVGFRDALRRVIDEVVAPGAAAVDVSGEFPRAGLDSLGAAGLLALTVPAEYGGGGGGPREAAEVVRELGSVCGSTAMIVTMHYSGVAALVAGSDKDTLTEIAGGRHLTTLAFSETGSRSHFWAPVSTAVSEPGGSAVRLDAAKSWVTSAGEADSYVWSSRPMSLGGLGDGSDAGAAAGPMTLWLVPAGAPGLSVAGAFDGLGLRGNASTPLTADGVVVPLWAMLGADWAGLDLALAAVLPYFLICSAAMSAGLMRRLATETATHLQRTQLAHLGVALAQRAGPRAQLARLQIEADRTWAHIGDLAGRVVATGAVDSPQATLLPLSLLRSAGLTPGTDVGVRRFDIGVGLHGDHIGGEREAARALFAADPSDRVDAACMIDSNLLLFAREGVLPAGAVRVLAQTPPYDHCTMTAGPSAEGGDTGPWAGTDDAGASADGDFSGTSDILRFGELLLGMDYADASLRPLLDLEGLKEWRRPRLSGYEQLERAVDEAGFYAADGAITADGYRP
jgi:isovaleryl-CoA dehydrogenase